MLGPLGTVLIAMHLVGPSSPPTSLLPPFSLFCILTTTSVSWDARMSLALRMKFDCRKDCCNDRTEKKEMSFPFPKEFPLLNSQCLQLMQSQKHLVRNLLNLILAQLQILYAWCTLEGVRLDASQLVPLQLQLNQVRQATEQSIRVDATQFVVVEQPEKGISDYEKSLNHLLTLRST